MNPLFFFGNIANFVKLTIHHCGYYWATNRDFPEPGCCYIHSLPNTITVGSHITIYKRKAYYKIRGGRQLEFMFDIEHSVWRLVKKEEKVWFSLVSKWAVSSLATLSRKRVDDMTATIYRYLELQLQLDKWVYVNYMRFVLISCFKAGRWTLGEI